MKKLALVPDRFIRLMFSFNLLKTTLTYLVPSGIINSCLSLWPNTQERRGRVSISYILTQLNANTYGTFSTC